MRGRRAVAGPVGARGGRLGVVSALWWGRSSGKGACICAALLSPVGGESAAWHSSGPGMVETIVYLRGSRNGARPRITGCKTAWQTNLIRTSTPAHL